MRDNELAFSKVAEMLDTFENSGETPFRAAKKGEFGYRGGIVRFFNDSVVMLIAFSGGTADQDVEVAEFAYQTILLNTQ